MICVLGDAHLDVIVRLSGPLAEDTDTAATTAVLAGGQAANVAAWVAALGGQSRVIAARGTDFGAWLVADELARRGVQLVGPVLAGRTGVVVALSEGGAKRSMLTDRGIGPQLAADHLQADWLDCGWLHIPAYSLVCEPIRGAALAAARMRGAARLSLDLSSTAVLTDVGMLRELITGVRPDVVLGTQAEADLIGPVPGAEVIVKLGPGGVLAAGTHYPALPTVPVDSTGAGDAFAAGYIVGGIELGLSAAARAVATMGAMP